MIGIAIPAHNEEDSIAEAVTAARRAASHEALCGEDVCVVVALDDCSDGTGERARAAGARTVTLMARNVGAARARAADVMLEAGVRWLAFTDADTRVSEDWLVQQLALKADVVCGNVGIDDWSCHGEHAELAQAHFRATYADRDGHRHIHGANFGLTAQAYVRAGGFQPLDCHEDVALVRRLEALGDLHIAWSARPRVLTSARLRGRVIGGFADTLREMLTYALQPLADAAFVSPTGAAPAAVVASGASLRAAP